MGDPMWSYNRMIRKADQLEEDLLKYSHAEQCQMLLKEAARNIVEDIVKNGTNDEINRR